MSGVVDCWVAEIDVGRLPAARPFAHSDTAAAAQARIGHSGSWPKRLEPHAIGFELLTLGSACVVAWTGDCSLSARRFASTSGLDAEDDGLQAAAQGALHSSALFLAFCDELAGSPDQLVECVVLTSVPRFKLSRTVWVELVSTRDGGLVDPVPGERLGEHIDGRLVVFDNDVCVVASASSGHRRVNTSAVGGRV